MTRIVNCTLDNFAGIIAADISRLEGELKQAIQRTAEAAVPIVQGRVPIAFGDLRGSVHSAPMKTVIDAPHAASVEIGSMPHTPDMRRLVLWVKLRGLQGLTPGGRIKSRYSATAGPTTRYQARRVATLLKDQEVRGTATVGRHSPVDAAEQVANAIARGIEKHGTRPHWFARSSLPDIRKALDTEIRAVLRK